MSKKEKILNDWDGKQIDMYKVKQLVTKATGEKQTYKSLAKKLDVTDMTLIHWNKGKTKPPLDKVLKILELADCELNQILK